MMSGGGLDSVYRRIYGEFYLFSYCILIVTQIKEFLKKPSFAPSSESIGLFWDFHLIFFSLLHYTTLKLCTSYKPEQYNALLNACTLIFFLFFLFFWVKESMNLSKLLIIFVNKVLITNSGASRVTS